MAISRHLDLFVQTEFAIPSSGSMDLPDGGFKISETDPGLILSTRECSHCTWSLEGDLIELWCFVRQYCHKMSDFFCNYTCLNEKWHVTATNGSFSLDIKVVESLSITQYSEYVWSKLFWCGCVGGYFAVKFVQCLYTSWQDVVQSYW